jgi:hypothetical protein
VKRDERLLTTKRQREIKVPEVPMNAIGKLVSSAANVNVDEAAHKQKLLQSGVSRRS